MLVCTIPFQRAVSSLPRAGDRGGDAAEHGGCTPASDSLPSVSPDAVGQPQRGSEEAEGLG